MPATNPALLLEPCYSCLGMSLYNAMQLALWDSISQADSGTGPVEDFIARAGITDQTQIDAVTALHAAAVANGWWDKCDLIYPFVGGTAQAHAQNLKSSNFTITWNGTVTHNANGITGDGATGYGDTGYAASLSALLTLNSAHLGMYRRTNGTINNGVYVGCVPIGAFLSLSRTISATQISSSLNSAAASPSVSSTVLAFSVGTRVDAVNRQVMSGVINNSAASASAARPSINLFILATTNGGPAGTFSNANLAGITAGSGLTFAEYTVMAADWQTFNTSLGRQV